MKKIRPHFNPKIIKFTWHALERFKERFGGDDPVVLRRFLKTSVALFANKRYSEGVIFVMDNDTVITLYPPNPEHLPKIEQALDGQRMKSAKIAGKSRRMKN